MSRLRLGGRAIRWGVVVLVAALATALWAYERVGLRWRVGRRHAIGVDVSHHQGAIDWQRVHADGVTFAFIKATEGETWTDPLFSANWLEARRQGLARGAYHFFTFCAPGTKQARHFLDVVPDEPDTLPMVIDLEMEGNCSRRPCAEELAHEVQAFLSIVESTRRQRAVLYVTQEFLEQYGPVASQRELFVRAPGPEPPKLDGRAWTYWQFDDDGRVDGIAGPVDLDAFRGGPAR